jgi:hypothetical protein
VLRDVARLFAATGVLRDPGLDKLPHEGGRQRFVGLETDCAFADIVICQFVLVSAHHAIDRAMFFGRAKPRKTLSIELESRELVADALFAFGTADRMIFRSLSSAARLSSLKPARYSSMVAGFTDSVNQNMPFSFGDLSRRKQHRAEGASTRR